MTPTPPAINAGLAALRSYLPGEHDEDARMVVAIYEAMSAAMWQPPESAPIGEKLEIYGTAGQRYAQLDEMGQWRNMMTCPVNYVVTHWRPLPAPPKE